MLDSYFEEVKKRRNISRIFWLVVFIFATTLFLFFKGYYFSLDLGFKAIIPSSQESSATGYTEKSPEPETVFKQFGVIHIFTRPSNAQILFDTEEINSGERKMVDYGEHTIGYQKSGYIGGEREISIDENIPYYMDRISLVSQPVYADTSLPKDLKFSHIEDDAWLTHSASGAWVYSQKFEQKIQVPFSEDWRVLGNGYVLDTDGLRQYNRFLGEFRQKESPELSNFFRRCANPHYQVGFISCENHNSIINFDGKSFTGVVDQGKNYIKTDKRLHVFGEKWTDMKEYLLTGSLEASQNFINLDDDWYSISGATLVPIEESAGLENISFGTGGIFASQKIHDYFVFLAEKNQEKTAIIFDPKHEQEPNFIPLPDDNYSNIEIFAVDDTIFIKTDTALFFFYKKDSTYHGIAEGEILAFGKNFTLYIPKNQESPRVIWRADWKIGR